MNPADFIISLTSADRKDRRKTHSCHRNRRWWLARFCTLSNLLKCNNLVRWANWLSSQHPVVLVITAHALSSPPEKMLFGEVMRKGVKKLSCFYSQHLQFDNTAVPDILRSKQHLCAASWFETGRFKYYIDKIVKCKIRYCRTSLIPKEILVPETALKKIPVQPVTHWAQLYENKDNKVLNMSEIRQTYER